ncbi:MAG: hypothetical protein ABJO29_00405 [Yoonia sp.]|uniref:DUF6931 family protein n=1 Tax=Rhodobacterales TaxID=204455 RepID=UPI001FF3FB4A|nr:hypothetical protein [Loktanella sp. F6476L]MCK0122296.1 hypothetical protein [Loktanella sp. F6476L]UWR01316.1 hypothetical protein K3729_18940 [Rhodobacteraceae bacterium S2214]
MSFQDITAVPLDDSDKTRPPSASLRFQELTDLYAGIPQIAEVTQQRPRPPEDTYDFMWRLRRSETPEDAITLTAFAFVPKMAIWWGHECLRTMPEILTPADHHFMEGVGRWLGDPSRENRHKLMKDALWSPDRVPGMYLALAVGWSGGAIAPNDPASPPLHRAPRALNTAVLSCLAQTATSRRQIYYAHFMDVAQSLFRVY